MTDLTRLIAEDLQKAGATGVQVWRDDVSGWCRVLAHGLTEVVVREVVLLEASLWSRGGRITIRRSSGNVLTGKVAMLFHVLPRGVAPAPLPPEA